MFQLLWDFIIGLHVCVLGTFSGMLSQPLGAALVAGLATGKLSEAMVVGAGIQLVYLESPPHRAAMCLVIRL